jgi:ribosomal protection tetracycline resistance protein
MRQNIKNIGIFAHVDAGKTSITEHFLFAAGQIKSIGSVDEGSTVSDEMSIEKERGISVKSSYISFEIDDHLINLVDTPGHVDFSSELERSLLVIEGAVLLLSAVEGVQAHTLTIWNALRKRHIPTIFFINKIDRPGADSQQVIEDIKKELTDSLIELNTVDQEGKDNAGTKELFKANKLNDTILEALSEQSDEILENYLEGNPVDFDLAEKVLREAVHTCQVYPVLCGSAKFSVGINELIQSVINYLPNFPQAKHDTPSGIVFGIKHEKDGKYALVKLLSGSIKVKDLIQYSENAHEEKINALRKKLGAKYIQLDALHAGDIAEVSGLKEAKTGDRIGEIENEKTKKAILKTPLLTVQIKAEEEKHYADLAKALQILTEEDPYLDFEWIKEEQELHVKVMGWMQMQIIERILEDRFGLIAKFEDPTVIYKETPSKTGEGFVQYWMPKPCWAILKFKIEAGERGSGVFYESKISVDDVHQKYQNEVERTIPNALKQGIKGWEVTDIKISLIEGEDHEIHSRPGDFKIATPMGIMNGLNEIGTTLLEPILSFKITAPEDLLGKITSDIIQMRGTFNSPETENDMFIIQGTMPLATSIDYPVKLSSRSGGKAKISTEFHSYQACKDEEGVIREYKGISPLDTAKYILKARKAIQ